LKAFNAAYDALNTKSSSGGKEGVDMQNFVNGGAMGSTGLGLGLRLSMELQRSIVNQCVSLIEKDSIRKTKNFRHATLNITNEGQNGGRRFTGEAKEEKEKGHLWSKPYALTKLATFLFDIHRENKKWAADKDRLPLILMAENPETDSYVVIGCNCPEKLGDITKNRFGRFFLEAANIVQAKLVAERFESNIVELRRENLQNFFEQLNTVMGA